MKRALLSFAIVLLSLGLVNAQNQSPFKVDTTTSSKLGIIKQNRWLLSLQDSIVIRHFDFPIPNNTERNLVTSFSNMPVYVPDGKHTMPIYIPDTAVTYKKQIFNID